VGVDAKGGVWVLAGSGVYWWDGEEFRRAPEGRIRAGAYITKLYGGPRNGLYTTQQGDGRSGEVYRLKGGQATHVTSFHYARSHDYPRFRVSRDGRFLNWDTDRLRVYSDQQWTEVPAEIPQARPPIFDDGENLYLYGKGVLYAIGPKGAIKKTRLDGLSEKDWRLGTAWGTGRAIFLRRGHPGVRAYDLRTGQAVSADAISSCLGDRPLRYAFSDPRGDAWIVASDRELGATVAFRATPDGGTGLVRELVGLPWYNVNHDRYPGRVLFASDGALWVAFPKVGLVRYSRGEVKRFDFRRDGSPLYCQMFAEGPDGTIYVGGDEVLYAYRKGSPERQPWSDLPPLLELPEPMWRYAPGTGQWLNKAWCVGDRVLTTTRREREIVALRAHDGSKDFVLPVGRYASGTNWICPGTTPDKALLARHDEVLELDLQSGRATSVLKYKRSHVVDPVRVGPDYVLPDGRRVRSISRVNPEGDKVWSCRLPGYVMTHAAVFGSFLVLQTRGGSYGGQATCGIDLDTGKMLWRDTVDAYGCGAGFGDDAVFCVEGNCWLHYQSTAGWLIAREPWTGKRLWEYRRKDTMLWQCPIVDRATNRVYAAFDDGAVVCLEGKTGSVRWETVLPYEPFSLANDHPRWPSIRLAGKLVCVMDRFAILYFIDADRGTVWSRVDLNDDGSGDLAVSGMASPIAMPWIVAGQLIVPTERSVAAYPLGKLLGAAPLWVRPHPPER